MFAVQGIYDGGSILPQEAIPVREAYEVVITFLRPKKAEKIDNLLSIAKKPKDFSVAERVAALDRLAGIASKNPISLEEARAERLARQ